MGTYKVIQDIEAEDKLLGPLSLRQFIYAIIVIVTGFVAFRLMLINLLLAIPLLPPMILFGVLASPFSKDQPSEVWLLAKIRFFLVPRKRIWDQGGIKELVTITVPKRIEKALVKDLSQTEVRSRLEALANTIDSRGWAVKNVNVNMFAQPSYVLGQVDSDRLIDASTMAQEVSALDVGATDDMFDVQGSRAQVLDQMMASSSQTHKQQVIQKMKSPAATQPTTPADYWFLNESPAADQPAAGYTKFNKSQLVQPGQPTSSNQPVTSAGPSNADEAALLDKIHTEKARPNPGSSHLRNIKPISEQAEPKSKSSAADPNITDLARNNDLNIETISRQANKPAKKHDDDDEVVVSLR
jgi:hypothetical protein